MLEGFKPSWYRVASGPALFCFNVRQNINAFSQPHVSQTKYSQGGWQSTVTTNKIMK